jgi:phospholipase/lecithinase/hemolysin
MIGIAVRTRCARAAAIRWTMLSCTALLLAAPGLAAAQSRFSGIVVFGTSLSDPGNAFALVGDSGRPPDFTLSPLLIPSAPYAKGGHHFSNGATWVEQFARAAGLSSSVRPALLDPSATNYAVGAARAHNDDVNFNLTRQVDTFLEHSGNVASVQALYVVEMGSNDIRDAFTVYATGGDGGPILTDALASIAANIQRLYAAGAREFLVWLPPNVALTPALRSLPPAAQGLAAWLTQVFDANLSGVLVQLEQNLPGANVITLDAYQLLQSIVADPAAFNLANVTAACMTPNVAPFSCADADGFLFWDGIHPTTAGHAIVAREAARLVQ